MESGTIYSPFLDEAATHFVAGVNLYRSQLSASDEDRDALTIIRSIVSLHLATEKVLKHTLAQVDPALVIEGVKAKQLQRYRKRQLADGLPTLFCLPTEIRTHGLVGLLHIIEDVIGPDVDSKIFEQFRDQSKALADLRNQAVHGELFGQSESILSILTQLLSRFRPVFSVVCPDFFEKVKEKDDQLDSVLKGIEQDVDGNWQVLVDALGRGVSISTEYRLWAVLGPSGKQTEFVLASEQTHHGNRIGASGALGSRRATGFFGELLDESASRHLSSATGLLAALGEDFGFPQGTMRESPRGLIPMSDGTLELPDLDGFAFFRIPDLKNKSVVVSVLLKDWVLNFSEGEPEGEISGRLISGASTGKAADAGIIVAEGDAWLNSEFTLTEATETFGAGSVQRGIIGEMQFRLLEARSRITPPAGSPDTGSGISPRTSADGTDT